MHLNKINKIIDNKITLIVFLLFFPHAFHIGFPSNDFWWVDYIIARWNMLSCLLLALIYVFIKKKKPSLLMIVMGLAELWIIITTYLYNPDRLFKATLYACSSMSIAMLIELYIDDLKSLINGLLLALEMQLYPNIISIFIYRNVPELTPGYNLNNYLLGTKNDLILYLMPAFCLAIIYFLKVKKSIRPLLTISMVLLTIVLSRSTTTLASFSLFCLVFIYLVLIRKNKIKNVYLIVSIPIFFGLLIILPYIFFKTNPIVDFIMNNVYYKHSFISRTAIWTDASNYIKDRLLTGYGYINQSLVFVDDIGRTYAGNAHCDLIQRLLNYGLIGLILFIVFNFLIIKKLNKAENSIIKSLFVALLCGIYITFISQDYHRFFELQIVFFLAYYSQNIVDYNDILHLELAKKNDFLSFYLLKREKSNVFWAGWISKPILKELLTFFNKAIKDSNNKESRKIYMVNRGVSLMGYIYIDYVDDDTFHISPAISERYQGKGYGKEAIDLAVKEGINLGFNKAEAYIREDNIASRKCFEKCGFVQTDIYENKYIPNQNKEIKMIRYLYENK